MTFVVVSIMALLQHASAEASITVTVCIIVLLRTGTAGTASHSR